MSAAPLEIRAITPADLPAAAAYNDRVYFPGAATFQPDFFDWQFNRCGGVERGDDNGAFAAFQDGAVVGACLIGRYPVSQSGQVVEGGWIQYWFADSDHPMLGLRLFNRALEGLAFMGGARIVPGAAAVMAALRRPWLWFELERLIAVVDPLATATLAGEAENRDTLRYLRGMRVPAPAPGVTAGPVERFDADYEAVWADCRPAFVIATDRTARLMNWRYTDHPRFTYRRLRCAGPAGTAYFVWREEAVKGHPWRVGRICEAIGAPAALAESFPTAFAAMAGDGVAFVDFACSNGDVCAALTAGGMAPAVTRPGFDLPSRFQPLEPYPSKRLDYYMLFPGAPPANHTAWQRTYLTKGDSNQDIPR